QGSLVDHALSGFESALLHLPRNQISLRDFDLLFLAIARQPQHFHTIEQRLRDRLERVGCSDEKHLRQIKGLVEIVVAESAILLRIEYLEQRRSRVSAEIAAQLVHFV